MEKLNFELLHKLLSRFKPKAVSVKPSLFAGRFKYHQKELDRLLTRSKIKPEVYRYLSKELQQHGDLLRSNSKTFERLFKMLIKSKTKGSHMKEDKVRQYEAVRDVWAGRKKKS